VYKSFFGNKKKQNCTCATNQAGISTSVVKQQIATSRNKVVEVDIDYQSVKITGILLQLKSQQDTTICALASLRLNFVTI